MKKTENLALQRNVILEIDEEICLLLAERQKISNDIQALKKIKNLPKEDLVWEDEQNKNIELLAARYYLNPHILIDIWNIIRNDVKK